MLYTNTLNEYDNTNWCTELFIKRQVKKIIIKKYHTRICR